MGHASQRGSLQQRVEQAKQAMEKREYLLMETQAKISAILTDEERETRLMSLERLSMFMGVTKGNLTVMDKRDIRLQEAQVAAINLVGLERCKQ